MPYASCMQFATRTLFYTQPNESSGVAFNVVAMSNIYNNFKLTLSFYIYLLRTSDLSWVVCPPHLEMCCPKFFSEQKILKRLIGKV